VISGTTSRKSARESVCTTMAPSSATLVFVSVITPSSASI
jgi:hypothetical protein